VAAILAVLCGYYSARNFSIDTNVNKLISSELDWRKNELALDAAFPSRHEIIVAVVEAPTSELASQATAELIEKLATHTKVFKSVTEPAGGAFFSKNALLFASLDQTTAFTSQFAQARPLIQVLVSDQNWRGLVQGLSLALAGVQRNMYTLDAMDRPLTMFASTIEDAIAGRPASFSWRELAAGKSPTPGDLRRIIEIRPVLDFAALEPGEHSTARGIGEGAENRVELAGRIVNHKVKCERQSKSCQVAERERRKALTRVPVSLRHGPAVLRVQDQPVPRYLYNPIPLSGCGQQHLSG